MTTLTNERLGILDHCQQLRELGQLGEKAMALIGQVEAAEREWREVEAEYAAQVVPKPVSP